MSHLNNSRRLPVFAIPVFFFLLLASVPRAGAAASFPDVPADTVNYNAVEYLKQKSVISGYPDGTFLPEKTINRAEALKMVLLATAANTESTAVISFPDVSVDDWFYDYVRKGFELKIIQGYPDGKFKAGNNINVAESLKMILLAFGEILSSNITANPYPDVEKGLWYAPFADYSMRKTLIWPMDDGKLHAEREITRGEFAQIIYRLMYIKENKLEKFPISTDWPVYTHPTDHYLVKVPFSWQKLTAGNQLILWKQDQANNQISFGRTYPNGAVIVIAVDPNKSGSSFDDYLGKLKYYKTGITQKLTLNGYPFANISITGTRFSDFYIELTNNTILAAYSELGDGLNEPQILEEIRHVIGSIRYTEESSGITDRDSFLSKVREMVLIEGSSKAALDLFPEIILIETDAIGIGTGPVDYYYNSEYDVTLKIDRTSGTLLGMRDGKTTRF